MTKPVGVSLSSNKLLPKLITSAVRASLVGLCFCQIGYSQVNPEASQMPSPGGAVQAPAFDVSTVKPSQSSRGASLWPTPDGYIANGITLRQLVQVAYRFFNKQFVIGGPAWVDTDKFDFEAKFDASHITSTKPLTDRQRTELLQPVLAERFQLKLHKDKKAFPVYNLLPAKGGLKVRASLKPAGTECTIMGGQGVDVVVSCTMEEFAEHMWYPTGRTVIDKTGLTDRYDFELHWTPDDTPPNSPNADSPSIFTAVQEQLGLRLEPGTAPLDVLIVDSAEEPTPN